MFICCQKKHWIPAVIWVLSDRGERVWRDSMGDVFIVDPYREINPNKVVQELRKAQGHGWRTNDVVTKPRGLGDDQSEVL